MSMTEKLAISLPRELLAMVERIRRKTGENRSALVQRALRELVRSEERIARARRYTEGYRVAPETRSEVRAAEASATALLAGEPWE